MMKEPENSEEDYSDLLLSLEEMNFDDDEFHDHEEDEVEIEDDEILDGGKEEVKGEMEGGEDDDIGGDDDSLSDHEKNVNTSSKKRGGERDILENEIRKQISAIQQEGAYYKRKYEECMETLKERDNQIQKLNEELKQRGETKGGDEVVLWKKKVEEIEIEKNKEIVTLTKELNMLEEDNLQLAKDLEEAKKRIDTLTQQVDPQKKETVGESPKSPNGPNLPQIQSQTEDNTKITGITTLLAERERCIIELQSQIQQQEERSVTESVLSTQRQSKVIELNETLATRDAHIVELRRLLQNPQNPTPISQSDKIDRSVHEAALQMMRVIQREHALETERIGRDLGEERFRHEETRRKLEELSIVTSQLRKQVDTEDSEKGKLVGELKEAKEISKILQRKLKDFAGIDGSNNDDKEEGPVHKLRHALEAAVGQIDAERKALAMEREAHTLTHSALRDEQLRHARERESLENELSNAKKNLAAVVEEVLAVEDMISVKERSITTLEARLQEREARSPELDAVKKERDMLRVELEAVSNTSKQLQTQLKHTSNVSWPIYVHSPPSPTLQHHIYQYPTQFQIPHTTTYPDVNINQLSGYRPIPRAPVEHHTLGQSSDIHNIPSLFTSRNNVWESSTASLRGVHSPEVFPSPPRSPLSVQMLNRHSQPTEYIPTSTLTTRTSTTDNSNNHFPPHNKPINKATELNTLLTKTSKTIAGKTVEMENIRMQLQATEARLRLLQKEKAAMDAQRDSLVGNALGLDALSKSLTKGISTV